jgi:hypothetical protein
MEDSFASSLDTVSVCNRLLVCGCIIFKASDECTFAGNEFVDSFVVGCGFANAKIFAKLVFGDVVSSCTSNGGCGCGCGCGCSCD